MPHDTQTTTWRDKQANRSDPIEMALNAWTNHSLVAPYDRMALAIQLASAILCRMGIVEPATNTLIRTHHERFSNDEARTRCEGSNLLDEQPKKYRES